MKFKSDIEVQAGLKDSSGAAGTSGQVLSSNGTTVSWVNPGAGAANDVQNQVKAGVAINKGRAVYVTSADGTNIIVGLASNTSEATSSKTLGLLNATVAANGFADVIQIGKLAGLNTIGAVIGDPVWLGTNGNLIYGLANKPYAPAHLVYIGVVTRVNANNGEIFITVQNGFELDELHNVSARTPSNNNGIFYNTSTSLWEAKSISTAGGIEGSGITNYVPKFTGTSSISNSLIFDNGTSVLIGTTGSTTSRMLVSQSTQSSSVSTFLHSNSSSSATILDLIHFGSGNFIIGTNLSGVVFRVDNAGSTIANKFIKTGGTADQYLKADGSVSTAMNSRVEANFVATSGQTTFVTPYEVGQIDVYYNGSKLYPNEFTATNGTDVVLAQAATLGAQISIIKYVSSFTTTSIRNESVFTTTAGQTTFAVNYAIGQVDVFYNGSKLSPAEFTATNGTSVVLGFACAAGESIVIDSFVNQVSGAVGTANKVAKFTGTASLGDSQIYDNGTNVGIGTTSPTEKLEVNGNVFLNKTNATLELGNGTASYSSIGYNNSIDYLDIKHKYTVGGIRMLVNTSTEAMRITSGGNVGIGTANPEFKLDVAGGDIALSRFQKLQFTGGTVGDRNRAYIGGTGNNDLIFAVGGAAEAMRIHNSSNVLIGTTTDAGYKLDVNGKARVLNELNVTIAAASSSSPTLSMSQSGSSGAYGQIAGAGDMYHGLIFRGIPSNYSDYAVTAGDYMSFYEYGGDFRFYKKSVSELTQLARITSSGITAPAFTPTSDIRLKNLITYNYDVKEIKPITYNWKYGDDKRKKIGYSAQQIQEFLPESVDTDEDGVLSVDYNQIFVAKIDMLENIIQDLKAEIEILKNK